MWNQSNSALILDIKCWIWIYKPQHKNMIGLKQVAAIRSKSSTIQTSLLQSKNQQIRETEREGRNMTWSWGTGRREIEGRSREGAAKRERRRRRERGTEEPLEQEILEPSPRKDRSLCHKDPPMIGGISTTSSSMGRVVSLQWLPLSPFLLKISNSFRSLVLPCSW